MPSPVGHILSGAAVYLAGTKQKPRSILTWGVTLFASIAPDFDFVPGILIGRMGAYHHGISHSLTFAVLFGAIVFVVLRFLGNAVAMQGAILATLSYSGHVLLDFISVNEGSRGVPILWPLSDEKFAFGLNLFGHFLWGGEGLRTIFRLENIVPILREILFIGSVLLLTVFWDRRSGRKFRGLTTRRNY